MAPFAALDKGRPHGQTLSHDGSWLSRGSTEAAADRRADRHSQLVPARHGQGAAADPRRAPLRPWQPGRRIRRRAGCRYPARGCRRSAAARGGGRRRSISRAVAAAIAEGAVPLVLGGDHIDQLPGGRGDRRRARPGQHPPFRRASRSLRRFRRRSALARLAVRADHGARPRQAPRPGRHPHAQRPLPRAGRAVRGRDRSRCATSRPIACPPSMARSTSASTSTASIRPSRPACRTTSPAG